MSVQEGTILRVVASLLFPDDVIMQNVFHISLTTIVGGGDEEDVVDDLVEWIDDIYAELVSEIATAIDGDEIKVYEYDAADDDFDEIGSGVMTLAAAGGTEMMPHGVAFMQTYKTLDPDIDGRKYWGGFVEASHIDGDWWSGTLANGVDVANIVINTVTGGTTGNSYQPIVWSPTQKIGQAYSGTVIHNAVVAYQRRRKPGVGI